MVILKWCRRNAQRGATNSAAYFPNAPAIPPKNDLNARKVTIILTIVHAFKHHFGSSFCWGKICAEFSTYTRANVLTVDMNEQDLYFYSKEQHIYYRS